MFNLIYYLFGFSHRMPSIFYRPNRRSSNGITGRFALPQSTQLLDPPPLPYPWLLGWFVSSDRCVIYTGYKKNNIYIKGDTGQLEHIAASFVISSGAIYFPSMLGELCTVNLIKKLNRPTRERIWNIYLHKAIESSNMYILYKKSTGVVTTRLSH